MQKGYNNHDLQIIKRELEKCRYNLSVVMGMTESLLIRADINNAIRQITETQKKNYENGDESEIIIS